MEPVPSEVWYAILGWLLATVGTAILKGLYQQISLWRWEKKVLSRIKIFAYDEERRDIYAVHSGQKREFELVVHIDSDVQRYRKCMSHIFRHFNHSLLNLSYTRKEGKELLSRKNLEVYVLKPYTSIADLPKGHWTMSRKEINERRSKK